MFGGRDFQIDVENRDYHYLSQNATGPRIVGDKRPPAARMDASGLRGTDVSQYKQYAGELRPLALSRRLS